MKIITSDKGVADLSSIYSTDLSNTKSKIFDEYDNSRLKMIKRTMYGKCGCRLLAAKLMVRV